MIEGSDQKPLLCIVLEGMDKQCTFPFNLEDLLGDTLITVSVINMTLLSGGQWGILSWESQNPITVQWEIGSFSHLLTYNQTSFWNQWSRLLLCFRKTAGFRHVFTFCINKPCPLFYYWAFHVKLTKYQDLTVLVLGSPSRGCVHLWWLVKPGWSNGERGLNLCLFSRDPPCDVLLCGFSTCTSAVTNVI